MNLNNFSDKIVFNILKDIKFGYLEITNHINGEFLNLEIPNRSF